MSSRPRGLADFENPPVVEVVLAVQFERLEAFRSAHLGLLWAEFRERFPRTEEQPPLEPVVEEFGPSISPRGGVRVEALLAPPVPRIWFLNETGTQLIQAQPDRFIHNWRKSGEGAKYPRYETIRESFRQELETFERYVSREKLGELHVNQCEVTYVNHIVAGEGWDRHGQLGEVINLWAASREDSVLPEPEDASFRTRFVLRETGGNPIGRLHVELQPAWRVADKKPMYVLRLVARGAPQGKGINGAFEFMDIGRKWIVEAFARITTLRMHIIWRRLDAK